MKIIIYITLNLSYLVISIKR